MFSTSVAVQLSVLAEQPGLARAAHCFLGQDRLASSTSERYVVPLAPEEHKWIANNCPVESCVFEAPCISYWFTDKRSLFAVLMCWCCSVQG